jgi:hypothetical protein
VYPNRPKNCKNFYCDWVMGRVGGKHFRPDRLGVFFDTVIEASQGKTLQVWEHHKDALKKTPVREYMKSMHKRGWFIVTWDTESNKTLYFPDNHPADQAIDFPGEVLPGSAL